MIAARAIAYAQLLGSTLDQCSTLQADVPKRTAGLRPFDGKDFPGRGRAIFQREHAVIPRGWSAVRLDVVRCRAIRQMRGKRSRPILYADIHDERSRRSVGRYREL